MKSIPEEITIPFNKVHGTLFFMSLLTLLWSAYAPHDYESWFLLSFFAIMIVVVLTLTYNKFRFSTFVYVVVFIHVVILLIGAKYTYTENPLFDIISDFLDLNRNYFDRVGHFAQGFTPAIMAKEILWRKERMNRDLFFYVFILFASMGTSALYELCEFMVSFVTDIPGEVILGLQGDVFDTHKDILMALFGSLTAMLLFGPYHDKIIKKMGFTKNG